MLSLSPPPPALDEGCARNFLGT
uniref:Uncharacterized protein n=1 Tax=Lepeophtheirus salmonis TaxID=72036 RepID=A0A0K2U1L7_LEPSM